MLNETFFCKFQTPWYSYSVLGCISSAVCFFAQQFSLEICINGIFVVALLIILFLEQPSSRIYSQGSRRIDSRKLSSHGDVFSV